MAKKKESPNKLNSKLVGYSLAIVSGVIYVVCVLLLAISPRGTMMVFGNMFHGVNMMAIANTSVVPVGSVVIGLIEIMIIGFVIGWLFAYVYNYLIEKMK